MWFSHGLRSHRTVNTVGCHVCVIYPLKSIKVHNCAVVSDRTFISVLNTSGVEGVSAVVQCVGHVSTSGVQGHVVKASGRFM